MTFKLPLPDEFSDYYSGTEEELLHNVKIIYAIDLYLNEKITIMKAAELCSLTLENFIAELKKRGIRRKTGIDSPDQLQQEIQDFEQFVK